MEGNASPFFYEVQTLNREVYRIKTKVSFFFDTIDTLPKRLKNECGPFLNSVYHIITEKQLLEK